MTKLQRQCAARKQWRKDYKAFKAVIKAKADELEQVQIEQRLARLPANASFELQRQVIKECRE